MKVRRWVLFSLVLIGLATVTVTTITGQDSDKIRVQDNAGRRDVPLYEALKVNLSPTSRSAAVVDVATVAALAANVYEPDDLEDASCNPSAPGRIPIPGWTRVKTPEIYPSACAEDLSGLHYELWTNYTDGFALVAIVFRGTIPEKLVHWCSNLRDAHLPMCDPESDQYLRIAPLVDDFLDRNYDFGNGPDSYVFAIGHSLGGGLAEMAARGYHISRVFSIDGSPVTAPAVTAALQDWVFQSAPGPSDQSSEASLPLSPGCRFAGNQTRSESTLGDVKVHSVYEKGEFLSIVRSLVRYFGFSPTPPLEWRTNLLKGNPVAQHSIKGMACQLLKSRDKKGVPSPEVVP